MGGPGSGRRYRAGARSSTDDGRAIDIRCWYRAGYLEPGTRISTRWTYHGRETASVGATVESLGHLVLLYSARREGSDWEDIRQGIDLDWTTCHFGGHRPWFLCPACRRRVAVLYTLGRLFGCRHCHNLAYASTREDVYERQLRKARRIRVHLGEVGAPGSLFPAKPEGMSWSTYQQLIDRAERYERDGLEGLLATLEALIDQEGR